MYPRLAGWHHAPGTTPVTALNVVAKNEGETLREWVSVLRGAAREVNDPIAEVVVGIDASVAVDGLQRVGLQPVTFSATRLPHPRCTCRAWTAAWRAWASSPSSRSSSPPLAT